MSALERIAHESCALARRAGAAILEIYAGSFAVETKSDDSPLTAADMASHRLIVQGLRELTPDIPVLSEESKSLDWSVRQTWERYWLVDPLDGTREFLNHNGEFTVNIGEVVDGNAVAGVVYAPAIGRLFMGDAGGAFEAMEDQAAARAIAARPAPQTGLIAVGSRSHNDEKTAAFLRQFDIGEFRSAGSSLKFCLVAAGEADIYARAGRTMEWDTAAGQAVLMAAGGSVTLWDGTPFTYGKPGFENPPFVARGR